MVEIPVRPAILTLDRNPRNLELLGQFLQRAGYQVFPAASLTDFCRALNETPAPRLALLDVSGFNAEIWAACEDLNRRAIPFLVILPCANADLQQAGLAHGARSVLLKPLAGRELLNLIRALL